jgi:hypothetical protein
MSIARALTEQGTLQMPLNSSPARSNWQVTMLAWAFADLGKAKRTNTNAIAFTLAITAISPVGSKGVLAARRISN